MPAFFVFVAPLLSIERWTVTLGSTIKKAIAAPRTDVKRRVCTWLLKFD